MLLALCLLIGLPPSLAPAAGISVVGGLTRKSRVQPGEKTEGRIIVRNSADVAQEVRVYQTDYLFRADGSNVYGEPGSVDRSNAPWITFTPRQFIVQPKEAASVHYTIQVPSDDKLTGTYWSMMMVQPVAPETLEPPKPEEGKVHIGIRTVVRQAVQMVTHIWSENPGYRGTVDMRFAHKQLVVQDGKRVLQLDLENTGERWLIPMVWAELYDEQGMSIGRFEGGRLRLYPGCSGRFNIDLTEVPRGNYSSLVIADNGDEYVFGARYQLDIE